MKKLLSILIIISVHFFSLNFVNAEEPQNSRTSILTKNHDSNNKKRIPSKNYIICGAINTMLVFDANFEYEYMAVEVSGSESLSDIITPLQPSIEAPALKGTYTIRCTTDDGAVYEGTITL